MKHKCTKCGNVDEVKTQARKGGKARWNNTTPEERSKITRAAAKARWSNQKTHE